MLLTMRMSSGVIRVMAGLHIERFSVLRPVAVTLFRGEESVFNVG